MVALLPMLLLFLFSQRYIVKPSAETATVGPADRAPLTRESP